MNKDIMIKYAITVILVIASVFTQAQSKLTEYVTVQLDKEFYIAGEDVWFSFLVYGNDMELSPISKVGYIEICDTKRPYVQHKLKISGGIGEGKIILPLEMPSGLYQLTGYTMSMMDNGVDSFFKKLIAVVNVNLYSTDDRVMLVDEINLMAKPITNSFELKSDESHYHTRQKVKINFHDLPEEIDNLIVSVYRNDSLTIIPDIQPILVKKNNTISSKSEYEGHIITGEIVPIDNLEQPIIHSYLSSTLGFAGNDIRYIQGKIDAGSNLVHFNIGPIYGTQEIVSTISSVDQRLFRLDIIPPFSGVLPTELPLLSMREANPSLMERSIGMQLKMIDTDSVRNEDDIKSYYNLQSHLTYNLDEYTRFNTMQETFTEYVRRINVSDVNGVKRLKVYLENEKRYNTGNTLVLLDGIPILNHEDIMNYNPALVKTINIYCEKYIFGGVTYDCIVAFHTFSANLPFIKLGSESQLYLYECPALPQKFISPIYDDTNRTSRKPDLRHTLYWNRFDKQIPEFVEFYTSDLKGEYIVKVEGLYKGDKTEAITIFNVED